TGLAPTEGAQVIRWDFNAQWFGAPNTYTGGAWSQGAPTLLSIGESAFFTGGCADKWRQIPDTSTNGLDVRGSTNIVLADEFLCRATGPISEIRVWGSWNNDVVPPSAFPCFTLTIWSDVPAQGTNYSHPGVAPCTHPFLIGERVPALFYTNANERFFD